MDEEFFYPSVEEQRRYVLSSRGPVVTAHFRRIGAKPLPLEAGYGEKKTVNALIDTGASDICIDARLAHYLDLPVVDERQMRGATGYGDSRIYAVQLSVPELEFHQVVEAWSANLSAHLSDGHAALLGRTFLKDYYFGYDGPKGVFYAIPAHRYNQPPPDNED